MRRNPTTGIKTKIYGNEEADVPIQMALWSSPAADARFQEVRTCYTIRYTTLTTQPSVGTTYLLRNTSPNAQLYIDFMTTGHIQIKHLIIHFYLI